MSNQINLNIISEENETEKAKASCVEEMTRETIFKDTLLLNKSDTYKKKLRILHFNDVYNIEEDKRESTAGAARFATAIQLLNEEGPCLVLFSGDAFSPSTCKLNDLHLFYLKAITLIFK